MRNSLFRRGYPWYRQRGNIRPAALVSTLAITLLVIAGLTYVFLSGGRTVSGFDFSELPAKGRSDAPVTVVVIEDFRCGSCQKFHADVVSTLERDHVAAGQVQLRFAVLPAVRKDSPELAALALSHAEYHGVPYAEVAAFLFEADSPRIEIERAESVLADRFGPLPPERKDELISNAKQRVIEIGKYLISRDVDRVPSVLVADALLFSPRRDLVLREIDRALAAGGTANEKS